MLKTMRKALERPEANLPRGQAMTEFVIWVFVLLLMISGILWFGRAYNLKLYCLSAARYISWSEMQVAETDRELDNILARAELYYPMQDEYGAEFNNLEPASLYNAEDMDSGGPGGDGMTVFAILGGMMDVASNTKGWSVSANYNPGGILNSTLPGGTTVHSQHFVSGGAWHKKQMEGDLIIMAVKGSLFLWSTTVLN
jgi:hypothetical protein